MEGEVEREEPRWRAWCRKLGAPLSLVLGASTSMPARFLAVIAFCVVGAAAISASTGAQRPVSNALPADPVVRPKAAAPAPVLASLVPTSRSQSFSPVATIPPGSFAGSMLPREGRIEPSDLCRTIGSGKGETGGWEPSPVHATEWECVSDIKRTRPKSETVGLFFMARGTREDEVRYVRFKLSLGAGRKEADGSKLLIEKIGSLFAALKWDMPERIPVSIGLLQPFEIDDRGTKIRFLKEVMTDGNYNLILSFPAMSVGRLQSQSGLVLSPSFVASLPKR